ncbi:hypothetical protein M2G63_18825 [Vibrio vulnificus]|nr:hypothetical protein [Vibrio vulnificus]MCU8540116.1 hypothetical protein [Vibrio vulnificus]MCU8543704.1 hypothetical protein [Vibrio vulnificus]
MTKIRKEKAELSSAAKNKKLSTPPPHHQLSFPCIRGSIHPHVPEAAFGNVLTATDNDESETNSNTNNEVRKMSHDARYTMGPRVREDDKNKRRKSRAKFNGKEQKTQHTAATPPTVIPAHAGIHTPTHARSRVGNVLTATDNDKSETNHNTDNEVPKPSHSARYPMGPRVREDDKNKKRKSRAKFSGKEQKKLSTPPPRPQLSFPRMRGSIHLHVPEAAFGNALAATDNDESEANNNTDNEVPKTSHGARYPMGPRFREDDSVRELIRTTSNTNNKALKPSYSARYTIALRVREDDKNKKRKSRAKFSGKEQKNSAHRRHAPSRHSRACGDPFIHTCQKPRLETCSPQQTTTKAKPIATRVMKCQKRATVLAIRWIPAFARMTG